MEKRNKAKDKKKEKKKYPYKKLNRRIRKMGWMKKLFKPKKKVELKKKEEPKEEHIITDDRGVCDYCGFEIFGEQKSIRKAGKTYHNKPCWRNLQKMAKREAFG